MLSYHQNILHLDDVPLPLIAEKFGTPCYIYSQKKLHEQYHLLANALKGVDARICFAVKANSNLAVLKALGQWGAGADIVSAGEMKRALAAGIKAEHMVYSGVAKTTQEMEFALGQGIGQINVESVPEIAAWSAVASRLNKIAPIAIRVNPDVDAGTHAKITTGLKHNKFGIDLAMALEVCRIAQTQPHVKLVGLACHIGSQLTSLTPFRRAFKRLHKAVLMLAEQGITLERLDIGGGLGVAYNTETPPPVEDYAKLIREELGDLGLKLVLEPGRFLVAEAGILLTQVVVVKTLPERRFLLVDAGMNDLVRPAMYDAWHNILPVQQNNNSETLDFDVAGPVCESSDVFGYDRLFPANIATGALLAITHAGAYGSVMSSFYNSRALVPEILVHNQQLAMTRQRVSIEEQMNWETIPAWLT
ncbi:MAG: diaminopimelate decarboxylase [Alphaproteobacteria bacterium]